MGHGDVALWTTTNKPLRSSEDSISRPFIQTTVCRVKIIIKAKCGHMWTKEDSIIHDASITSLHFHIPLPSIVFLASEMGEQIWKHQTSFLCHIDIIDSSIHLQGGRTKYSRHLIQKIKAYAILYIPGHHKSAVTFLYIPPPPPSRILLCNFCTT